MHSDYKIPANEMRHIRAMTDKIVAALNPLAVYLFGSFARGDYNEDSDYDFYVIMPSTEQRNLIELIVLAQMAIVDILNRDVDIIVQKGDFFEKYKDNKVSLEFDVATDGIRLYGLG